MVNRWMVSALLLTVVGVGAWITMPAHRAADAQAQSATATPESSSLPSYGPAPELTQAVWLNTDGGQPLALAELRGKVVLLHFWTLGCINCIRTLPYVTAWHAQYAADGLVVIGDHFPEFSYERDLNNLRSAIERFGITYAVAQDNDGTTWNAYNQSYWPTVYLIDKQGNLRYRHIGEGAYADTEAAIQSLLAEPYTAPAPTPESTSAPTA